MRIVEVKVIAYRRRDDARTLDAGFLGQKGGGYIVVGVVKVAYRFVYKKKVKRLADAPDDGYTLLLAD